MRSKPWKSKVAFPSLWASVFLFSVLFFAPEASLAAVGKPMVVYSEEGQTAVNYSTYSNETWAAGATAADVASSNEKYWKTATTHPAGRKKATLFVQNAASTPHLYAAVWDESQWDDGTGSPYGDAKDLGAVSTKDYRCFDAVFEDVSGRLELTTRS